MISDLLRQSGWFPACRGQECLGIGESWELGPDEIAASPTYVPLNLHLSHLSVP
jgi:hypothetical protein